MNWPDHGGQPEKMKQLFNFSKEKEMLDFSANLNPLGPPEWLEKEILQQSHVLSVYPDPTYEQARQAIADAEHVHTKQVLLTNGGAEAIFLAAKWQEGKRALIVQPTFVEYEQACRHYHIETEDVFLNDDNHFSFPVQEVWEKMAGVDVLFLCRPNNPTGTLIAEKDMRFLLERGQNTNTAIIVDEAFVHFLPEKVRLTSWLDTYSNLILLRSLTKIYTIPGLRLGYVLASRKATSTLQSFQMPWSVNALAAHLVPRLLQDRSFVAETRTWLTEQLDHLQDRLSALEFVLSPSYVNFYLLHDRFHPDRTEELFHFLLEKGILARHTHNFKGLDGRCLRLAVRSAAENERLLRGLTEWRERQ